jgi:hypothetical protein
MTTRFNHAISLAPFGVSAIVRATVLRALVTDDHRSSRSARLGSGGRSVPRSKR